MTTWFDVTTILGWRRPAVGIIRTEAEAATHALELIAAGEDVKFCFYSHATGYSAIDAAEVAATLKEFLARTCLRQAGSLQAVRIKVQSRPG